MNNKVHVKTGDTVIIISGKDRGKKGKVLAVSPKEGKVIVEGRNMVSASMSSPARWASQAALSRPKAPSMPARSRSSAPAAANRPVSPIRFMKTARRNAFAQNAASRCKGG